MTAHKFAVIKCDACGKCFLDGESSRARSLRAAAEAEGWTTGAHGLDACPRHSVDDL